MKRDWFVVWIYCFWLLILWACLTNDVEKWVGLPVATSVSAPKWMWWENKKAEGRVLKPTQDGLVYEGRVYVTVKKPAIGINVWLFCRLTFILLIVITLCGLFNALKKRKEV